MNIQKWALSVVSLNLMLFCTPLSSRTNPELKKNSKSECEFYYTGINKSLAKMNKTKPKHGGVKQLIEIYRENHDLYIRACTKLTSSEFFILSPFLLGTTLKNDSSNQIKIPEAKPSSRLLQNKLSLKIEITKDKRFSLTLINQSKNANKSKLRISNAKDLKNTIDDITAGNKNINIYIYQNIKDPFKPFVKLMDTLRILGLNNVYILSKNN